MSARSCQESGIGVKSRESEFLPTVKSRESEFPPTEQLAVG